MAIRFQADADLNQIIVSAVVRRVPAMDFRTAGSAGLAGVKDVDVLAASARDGRILVTHDQSTMPRHFGEFVQTQHSPGLIVVPQHLAIGDIAEDLILIWTATAPEEWTNRIVLADLAPAVCGTLCAPPFSDSIRLTIRTSGIRLTRVPSSLRGGSQIRAFQVLIPGSQAS